MKNRKISDYFDWSNRLRNRFICLSNIYKNKLHFKENLTEINGKFNPNSYISEGI